MINIKSIIITFVILLLACLPAFAVEAIEQATDELGRTYAKGRVIVRFKDPEKSLQQAQFATQGAAEGEGSESIYQLFDKVETIYKNENKLQAEGEFSGASVPADSPLHLHLIKLKEGVSVSKAVEELSESQDVLFAEPDYIVTPDMRGPDVFTDVELPLSNPPFNALYGLNVLGVENIWSDFYFGRDVLVAVIESGGFDINHPDLFVNIFVNTGEIPDNGIDDDGNGYVDDSRGYDFFANSGEVSYIRGHGTFVAGIIAAERNNSIGISGVAPKSMILPLVAPTGSSLLAAINYIVNFDDPNNSNRSRVRVVNFSGSLARVYNTNFASVLYNAIQDLRERGVVFVASAGNSDVNNSDLSQPDNLEIPAVFDNVISVAAVDHENKKASFSNYGSNVTVSAPGVNIVSLKPKDVAFDLGVTVDNSGMLLFHNVDGSDTDTAGEYAVSSGTSFSAPYVSGLAALIASKNSELTVLELEDILKRSLSVSVLTTNDKPMPRIISNVHFVLSNDVCRTRLVRCQTACRPADMCCGSGCPICRNAHNALDVNGDGVVSPIDALLVINLLNGDGSGFSSCETSPFYDVNGDGFTTPIDALQVINHLSADD